MGQPGVRSKRFAPNALNLTGTQLDEANNQELLRRLMGADEKRLTPGDGEEPDAGRANDAGETDDQARRCRGP